MAMLNVGSRLGPFPYQVRTSLNQNPGNMSEVCVAAVPSRSDDSESLVVIKLAAGPDEKHESFYQQSLLNEEQRLKQLKHPGIVRIFPIQFDNERRALTYSARATGLAGKPWFLVMELLQGGALTTMIQRNEIDIGLALEIARALAATLDYLHRNNQVHLDIKPDNVLFRTHPAAGRTVEPVLIDFGIARDIGEAGLEAKTIQYASPERVHELRNPGQPPEKKPLPHPSMDVYALGVVLYEMLTGVLPFQAINQRSLISSILAGAPKPPSAYNRKVNQELDEYVLKMLASRPDERPKAQAVAIQLEDIAIRSGYMPRYPTGSAEAGAAPHGLRRRRWPTLLAALLALLALLQLLFIAGTRPYWASQLTINPLAVLWQNLSGVGPVLPADEAAPSAPTASPTPPAAIATVATAAAALPPASPTVALTLAPAQSATTTVTGTNDPSPSMATIVTATLALATSTQLPPAPPIQEEAVSTTPAPVTSAPVVTPTRIATSTPLQPTTTATPTATSPSNTLAPTRADAIPAGLRVALVAPLDGADLSGEVVFRWLPTVKPPPGYGFEVFRWGQGATRELGQAMEQPTTGTSQRIDLDVLNLAPNRTYSWGVRLVRLGASNLAEAEARVLSEGNAFTYKP